MIKKTTIATLVATPMLLASAAMAQETILSFGYTNLNGVFTRTGGVGDNGTGVMTADASNLTLPGNDLRSSGDVTRLSVPAGTALFNAGFVSAADAADFHIELSILNNDGSFADGVGSFTITDLNGDTVTGNISGTWIRGGLGQTFFNGDLSNVQTNNISGDGLFNGNVGNFLLDLGAPGLFDGALVQLFLRPGTGFFDASFSQISTQVSGQIVPTPGALALAGLAGAAALRRRRSN